MRADWVTLTAYVDPERFASVSRNLDTQLREARWWRNACLAYFSQRSGLDFPSGVQPPANTLEHYQALEFPDAPGN